MGGGREGGREGEREGKVEDKMDPFFPSDSCHTQIFL